jgi:ribosomal protein S18 acetylase RimI-like enzyme
MAELVNFAGDGMPAYIWGTLAQPGQSAWDVGRDRARRGIGGFAYGTVIREIDGKVAACLIGYATGDTPRTIDDDTPPMFVPFFEIENDVLGSWYVNVLAAYPEHRGKGLGTELLELAEDIANNCGCSGLSLIVSDANDGGRRLYERVGFKVAGTRPIVKDDWQNPGKNWLSMVKEF